MASEWGKITRKISDADIAKQQLAQQNADMWNAVLNANQAYSATPSDQRFAYAEAPENLMGQGIGGASEPSIQPEDLIGLVPWKKMASLGIKGLGQVGERMLASEIGSAGKDISDLVAKEAAKKLAIQEAKSLKTYPGMFNPVGGEQIPSAELQLPNVRETLKKATSLSKHPEAKEALGTSMGQGTSVRYGNLEEAKDAAKKAILHQRRQPNIPFPDESKLTSQSKIDAARNALQEIGGSSGFGKSEGFKRLIEENKHLPNISQDEIYKFIETAQPHELEKILENEYMGGMEQFLKDYKKSYARDNYAYYAQRFHGAKNIKDKEKFKEMMDSIRAEGIHPND